MTVNNNTILDLQAEFMLSDNRIGQRQTDRECEKEISLGSGILLVLILL